jgi:hypothetical protein
MLTSRGRGKPLTACSFSESGLCGVDHDHAWLKEVIVELSNLPSWVDPVDVSGTSVPQKPYFAYEASKILHPLKLTTA